MLWNVGRNVRALQFDLIVLFLSKSVYVFVCSRIGYHTLCLDNIFADLISNCCRSHVCFWFIDIISIHMKYSTIQWNMPLCFSCGYINCPANFQVYSFPTKWGANVYKCKTIELFLRIKLNWFVSLNFSIHLVSMCTF